MITEKIEQAPRSRAQEVTPVPFSILGLWKALLLVVLASALYYPVLSKLVFDWWHNPDFSHGFFVPAFSAYLFWKQRSKILAIPAKPSWSGLFVILLSLAMLVVGVLGAELFLSRTSLVFLLAGLATFFWGWKRFRALLFPWAFLFLMIPIPTIIFNQITFPLQLLASKIASEILPLFNVPVLREGNVIYLPAMPLEVAEACSGIRSLMSLGTVAIIYAYLLETSTWRRIVLALASVPIAVAANAGRVIGTGFCVQYWDPNKALGFFHEFSGWVIFVISLVLLFVVHALIRIKHTPAGGN